MMVSLWFAWFPVKTNRGWRWLRKVDRRIRMDYANPLGWHYEYRSRDR